VIKDLTSDLLLGEDILNDTDAFKTYPEAFFVEDGDGTSGVNAIVWLNTIESILSRFCTPGSWRRISSLHFRIPNIELSSGFLGPREDEEESPTSKTLPKGVPRDGLTQKENAEFLVHKSPANILMTNTTLERFIGAN